jgi:TolB protein
MASLACASLGDWLQTATPAATPELAARDRLAVIGRDRNLYTVDPSTGEATALTGDAAVSPTGPSVIYGSPTWAPQTGQLAFTRTRISADGVQQVDLLVSSGQPGSSEAVFSDSTRTPFYMYWSPDGEVLSFLASAADGSLGIYVSRAGASALLLDQGQPYYWVWSPDGGTLLAHVGGAAADNPRNARLSLFQGQPLEGRLLDIPPGDFQAPDVAPDGRHMLVATRGGDGAVSLDMLDVGGGGVSRLAPLDGPVGFGWSPAGDSIAFVTLAGTSQETFGSLGWVDMTNPARPRPIPGVASHVAGFFWSPSGDKLAYLVPDVVTPGDQQQVANRSQSGQLVLNMFVAAANSRTAEKVASFAPTEDFLAVMPFFDQYERSMTIWSPDGSQLVFTAADANGPPGVYVVDADGQSAPRRVADGSLAVWAWR